MSLPFCTFAVFVHVDVQQQAGQAAQGVDSGEKQSSVTFPVGHRGITNLSAPNWFTGRRHCTGFRRVMQLSLLILC